MTSIDRNHKIEEIKKELQISDLDMARIVDDLIHSLVKAGVISIRHISDISRAKLDRRAFLRQQLFELCQEELEENPVTQTEHSCSSCHNCHSTDTP